MVPKALKDIALMVPGLLQPDFPARWPWTGMSEGDRILPVQPEIITEEETGQANAAGNAHDQTVGHPRQCKSDSSSKNVQNQGRVSQGFTPRKGLSGGQEDGAFTYRARPGWKRCSITSQPFC